VCVTFVTSVCVYACVAFAISSERYVRRRAKKLYRYRGETPERARTQPQGLASATPGESEKRALMTSSRLEADSQPVGKEAP
jgi:hypothetical protein